MGGGRKRLSGAKRREIKKKWKARTFLERGSESSGDDVVTSELTFNPETGIYLRKAGNMERERSEEEKEVGMREQGGETGRSEEERKTGAERRKGEQESDDGAGGRSRSGRGEQDRVAGGGMRGGSREHTLWPGALFDSHCHLNLVLRYQL